MSLSPTTIIMTKGIITFILFVIAVITLFKITSGKTRSKAILIVMSIILIIFIILAICMTIYLMSEVVDSSDSTKIIKEGIKL